MFSNKLPNEYKRLDKKSKFNSNYMVINFFDKKKIENEKLNKQVNYITRHIALLQDIFLFVKHENKSFIKNQIPHINRI